ncbi:MAG: tRNA pseudouridine(13) synthase TruD [Gemmataceae bacterium]
MIAGWNTLPLLTADLPGIGGVIKSQPEDFVVEEVPAYEPCGTGEHLFLWIEKRALGAEYFLRQIARRLGLNPQEIGSAGLKDRHAVTRQWVSVPAQAEPRLGQLDGEGIRLLHHTRHNNKLKPGHLRGNRFTLLIRQVVQPEALPALLERLRSHGLPNFYGSQRFGHDGETLALGLDLLRGRTPGSGKKPGGLMRRLALSAVQSALFNAYVAQRLREGCLRTVLPGDVMKKWPFGGLFNAVDVPAEQVRLEARETIPTGPMFGKKMFAAQAEAAQREAATLQAAGLSEAAFDAHGKLLSGTRRYAFVYVEGLSAERVPEGVRLSFTLPSGSYATVLVRELTHRDPQEAEDADE